MDKDELKVLKDIDKQLKHTFSLLNLMNNNICKINNNQIKRYNWYKKELSNINHNILLP